ncbi:MAG: cyclic pyranopterin monophosphate synthase MoaC [Devosia sp.]|uniref:cyclic pyranopterin monophosphate synthase MoaC n=1 Tax=Devosia sp. 66-22 TaxID=1895753 RepID=UPI00092A51E6|nr:cyclic pyranopterin monophosphate synthase MoaC [Devosia sp. 66-22]MBN9347387.1 cyclic pyranopterin monophosphate synthase MoaC [Devosia sp.]OJX53723.1 MAG: molybdenum cofactor biosynthesis protein C [Devosia sp. 66-22]
MSAKLTHLNERGEAHIVDIGAKPVTARRAVARAVLEAAPSTIEAIDGGTLKKGDAIAVARIAGIMAAKKTSDLIPLCHPIGLNKVEVDITVEGGNLVVLATAETSDRTGVEMEAMTAASVAALTLYDMAKGIDRAMRITAIELMEKSGGKSGDFRR